MRKRPILVVDDDEAITAAISAYLEAKGYPVTIVNDGAEALEAVRDGRYRIVVSDIYIDSISGLQILETAKAHNPEAAVILMTARGSVSTTVTAEELGAFEYLAKPFGMDELLQVIERAMAAATAEAPEEAEPEEPFGGMVGFAPPMVEVYKKIARYARSDETVLILGETGTGKELAARAVHDHSARAARPFVAVDSGAVAATLWESEIFGSLRGAFTGADRDRPGVVEAARGGTVFFDEVGEIPLEFQAKLLRLLEQREYRPVGAAAPRQANIRVIAATHRDLPAMVRGGKFRQDLLFRLDILRIEIPPLRVRGSDIGLLAKGFLKDAARAAGKRLWLDAEAAAALEEHEWPGNVRELKNAMLRLCASTQAGAIGRRQVEAILAASAAQPAAEEEEEPKALDDLERRQILKVLAETGGNKTRAAEILGIQRRTLYKKLDRIKSEPFGHGGMPEGHD
ncbi:MAG: sigma-54-dependent transcriptional regulator [Bryobacteraceae bacterium]